MGVVTAAPPKQSEKEAQNTSQPLPTIDFVAAADEHTEDVFDVTKTLTGSTQDLGTLDVPAFGYLRNIVLKVDATGGAGGNAVAQPDAPWSCLDSIEIDDTNGQPFYGPVSGYDAYLIHKWLSARPTAPQTYAAYSAPSVNGNFAFLLRLPIEINPRTALGSLANMNSQATYKVKVRLAASTSVFSTVPTTLPSVRVRAWAEEWTEPLSTDPTGQAQATEPPSLGTTQEFTTTDITVNAGKGTPRLTRMGNTIRGWIFVTRDPNSAQRISTAWPTDIDLMWDGRLLKHINLDLLNAYMIERYPEGYTLDTGVYVVDFAHDFDGRVGAELADGYLPTSTGSRIEVQGTYGAACTLHVITDDVLGFSGSAG